MRIGEIRRALADMDADAEVKFCDSNNTSRDIVSVKRSRMTGIVWLDQSEETPKGLERLE